MAITSVARGAPIFRPFTEKRHKGDPSSSWNAIETSKRMGEFQIIEQIYGSFTGAVGLNVLIIVS